MGGDGAEEVTQLWPILPLTSMAASRACRLRISDGLYIMQCWIGLFWSGTQSKRRGLKKRPWRWWLDGFHGDTILERAGQHRDICQLLRCKGSPYHD
jgi:hypothetical protein